MFEINNITSHRMIKLVVLIFVGCAIVLLFTTFNTIKSRIRDAERRSDIQNLVKALDIYHDKYDNYPDSVDDGQGWDLSVNYDSNGDLDFLAVLKKEGIIKKTIGDPVNDIFYNYRYRKYKAGEFGCQNSFYILQITNFELPTQNNGTGKCSDFDWVKTTPNGYTIQGFD